LAVSVSINLVASVVPVGKIKVMVTRRHATPQFDLKVTCASHENENNRYCDNGRQ